MATSGARVTDVITAEILSGAWKPGERLQPHRLADQYSVSTTVVREALSRMTGDGLVVVKPNKGFFIPNLREQELLDITELRCVTETLAVELALQRGDLEWESELIGAHHVMTKTPRRDPKTDQSSSEWLEAHRAFHATLLAACDCEPMTRIASNLSTATELYRRWASPSASSTSRDVEAEHEQILEAALARDAELTALRLRNHYEITAQVILKSGLINSEN